MASIDLPDLNVWLALADPDHQHHSRAQMYWEREAATELAFCRMTMLGFLRLLTHRQVMRGQPFTPPEAWRAFRAFAALPEVTFLHEPAEAPGSFATLSDHPDFPAHLWTDAWLAAIALSAAARIVSFDRDFASFPGLELLLLRPSE